MSGRSHWYKPFSWKIRLWSREGPPECVKRIGLILSLLCPQVPGSCAPVIVLLPRTLKSFQANLCTCHLRGWCIHRRHRLSIPGHSLLSFSPGAYSVLMPGTPWASSWDCNLCMLDHGSLPIAFTSPPMRSSVPAARCYGSCEGTFWWKVCCYPW